MAIKSGPAVVITKLIKPCFAAEQTVCISCCNSEIFVCKSKEGKKNVLMASEAVFMAYLS